MCVIIGRSGLFYRSGLPEYIDIVFVGPLSAVLRRTVILPRLKKSIYLDSPVTVRGKVREKVQKKFPSLVLLSNLPLVLL